MKKCFSIEEVVKAIQEQEDAAVQYGYVDKEDSDVYVEAFQTEVERFWECNNVVMMMVFEGTEIEDEELGMALVERNGKQVWGQVFMSYRYNDCRIIFR